MSQPSRVNTATDLTQFPLEERVRIRAHELYVLGDKASGSEMDDWLQAEEEVRAAEEQRASRE